MTLLDILTRMDNLLRFLSFFSLDQAQPSPKWKNIVVKNLAGLCLEGFNVKRSS